MHRRRCFCTVEPITRHLTAGLPRAARATRVSDRGKVPRVEDCGSIAGDGVLAVMPDDVLSDVE